ncbi:MAG TPA: Fe-S cluster assembly protein SufD [Chryseosolibacter sp.]|nr:Fe-S cluster assembly protein SufD [Chryseosolibacter sp.]
MDITTTNKDITTEVSSLIQRRMRNVQDPVRNKALEVFRQLGLPANKHEEYKYTPITRELQNNFSFDKPAADPLIKDVKEYLIPEMDANSIVFINGIFAPAHSNIQSSASQVKIADLEEALAANDAVANMQFNQHINSKSDAMAAWNTADWTAGLFISVPDNTIVAKPIVIYYINDTTPGEVIATNRNLVVIGKNSEVTIVEKFNSSGAGNHFTNHVNEIVVNENAKLEYYSIQNDRGNRFQYSQTEIYQKNTSRVNTYTFNLQGKLLRTNLHLIIDGEGIESHMYGLYLLKGNTLADNHTVVDHKKPNSFTNELYKGIMDENSKGVFNGKIYVRPQAQKTNAFQANRNILLSEKASVNTKPQLEIWADDVKCSHGCTTGQLDEEAMFYLRARGIDKNAARAMMLYAFAGEITDKIPDAGIRKYIDLAISERLQHNF